LITRSFCQNDGIDISPVIFNLEQDIAERHNLAAEMPAKLKELRAAHEAVMATLGKR